MFGPNSRPHTRLTQCGVRSSLTLARMLCSTIQLPARGPAHLRRQSRATSSLSTTSSCVAGRSASPEAPGTEPAEVSCGSSMCVGFASLGRSALDLWATHPSLARFILARALYQASSGIIRMQERKAARLRGRDDSRHEIIEFTRVSGPRYTSFQPQIDE